MSGDLEKISTPRGEGRSMTPLSPTSVSVNYREAGADWFGPLQPLRPIAPADVAGRAWDFPAGFNLNTQPRPYEPVSFEMLRAIADAYDPLRLIIERRKDQVCRLNWNIRPRHNGTGPRPKTSQLSAATQELVREVTEFFKTPSYEMPWRSWLRELMEDLFVIDAPSLAAERSPRGELIGLNPIDGSTIKRNIDRHGRTPRPLEWDGVTPFIWNGGEVNGANYRALGWQLHQGVAYPPAYTQILHGAPAATLTTRDLIYRPHNTRPGKPYGCSPVEQVIMTAGIALRRITSQGEYFQAGNVPAGIFNLPETWSVDQVSQFQSWWDTLFSGDLGRRRQMRFVAGSGKYQPFLEPNLKADFDEWMIRIICFAFSYPPNAFVQLSNRSIAEEHSRTAELEGLQPVKQWATDFINEIIEREWRTDEVEFAFVEEEEVNQVEQSKILARLVESGIITANEAREKLGEAPDPNPAANTLMVKTATGYAPLGATDNSTKETQDVQQ